MHLHTYARLHVANLDAAFAGNSSVKVDWAAAAKASGVAGHRNSSPKASIAISRLADTRRPRVWAGKGGRA
eukprot:2101320-Prorocentrum_lima.AAC.1